MSRPPGWDLVSRRLLAEIDCDDPPPRAFRAAFDDALLHGWADMERHVCDQGFEHGMEPIIAYAIAKYFYDLGKEDAYEERASEPRKRNE